MGANGAAAAEDDAVLLLAATEAPTISRDDPAPVAMQMTGAAEDAAAG